MIGLKPAANLWLDSRAFEAYAAKGLAPDNTSDSQNARHLDYLARAVELYTGDFLAGWSLPDSLAFDEWQFFERERLRRTLSQALDRQVQDHQPREEWEAALGYARRWAALDPLHEPGHIER